MPQCWDKSAGLECTSCYVLERSSAVVSGAICSMWSYFGRTVAIYFMHPFMPWSCVVHICACEE